MANFTLNLSQIASVLGGNNNGGNGGKTTKKAPKGEPLVSTTVEYTAVSGRKSTPYMVSVEKTTKGIWKKGADGKAYDTGNREERLKVWLYPQCQDKVTQTAEELKDLRKAVMSLPFALEEYTPACLKEAVCEMSIKDKDGAVQTATISIVDALVDLAKAGIRIGKSGKNSMMCMWVEPQEDGSYILKEAKSVPKKA